MVDDSIGIKVEVVDPRGTEVKVKALVQKVKKFTQSPSHP